MILEELTYRIRGAVFTIFKELGPGLLESVYEAVEIKSIETLHDVHEKQLLTYLRLADKRVGLLINFNVSVLEDKISIIRIVN
jgi:PD-(D/E)XK nuclease superfamily